MSKASYASLKETSDKLENRWQREFAGRPRHTRDLAVLDKMIEKATATARKAKVLKGDAADQLKVSVASRLNLYLTERAAIAEAIFDRPEIAAVHDTGRAIDAVYAEWRRHFAGQNRGTRDVARLEDLVTRLTAYETEMNAIAESQPDLVKPEGVMDVGAQLQLFQEELVELKKAREGVAGKDRLVNAFSEAQQALDRYKAHFAGQPRATCDPTIMAAIIARLKGALTILDGANGTDAAEIEGFEANRTTVGQQLALYESELGLVKTARDTAPPRDAGGLLAQSANAIFETYQKNYAGQSRHTRDLRLLSDLCDRLADIGAQMKICADEVADQSLRKNEEIVGDRRRLYENEWVEIAKAKAEAAKATPEVKSTTATAAPSRQSSDSLIRIVD